MSGKRARAASATTQQHVLKPVTVMPKRGGRKRQEYVDVSSSDSETQPQRPPPRLPATTPAIPPMKKQSRTRIPPKESAPPPVRSPSPPPSSPPAAKTKPPEPSSSQASQSRERKRPRPALETYAHTVHISRHQVEHEWILLSAPMRAHLRSDVEQVAKEMLETVSAGRSARDRAMRNHLEATFARFADEFDDLIATLPVPPLPPGLPPNLLGVPEPDSGSIPSASSSSLSSKSKKKLEKGKGNESATAAESTSAERPDPDVGGDGRSDWSLEALEAYLAALEKRAEQAEAAAVATRDEGVAVASTAKTRVKSKTAAVAKGIEKEDEGKEEALRPAGPRGEGNQRGSRSRRKIAEAATEEEEDELPEKRVRKKQGTSRAK